jgi:cyclophilin family peptidyl-prolyl cis-trans isomerase
MHTGKEAYMFRKVVNVLACLALVGVSLSAAVAQEAETKTAVTAKEEAKKVSERPQVMMKTSKGDMVIELFPEKAPITVENFLHYVKDGFFDGTIFHRVMPGFVIQGGGFTAKMEKKKTHEPIKNEADNGLKNKRGTLSMARTRAIHSATSQFFINLQDNVGLDHQGAANFGYAVFGRLAKGLDVMDEIAKAPTGNAVDATGMTHNDVPKEPITIVKAYVVETAEEAEKTD